MVTQVLCSPSNAVPSYLIYTYASYILKVRKADGVGTLDSLKNQQKTRNAPLLP